MTKEPFGKLPKAPQMDHFAFYHKVKWLQAIVKGTKISDVSKKGGEEGLFQTHQDCSKEIKITIKISLIFFPVG